MFSPKSEYQHRRIGWKGENVLSGQLPHIRFGDVFVAASDYARSAMLRRGALLCYCFRPTGEMREKRWKPSIALQNHEGLERLDVSRRRASLSVRNVFRTSSWWGAELFVLCNFSPSQNFFRSCFVFPFSSPSCRVWEKFFSANGAFFTTIYSDEGTIAKVKIGRNKLFNSSHGKFTAIFCCRLFIWDSSKNWRDNRAVNCEYLAAFRLAPLGSGTGCNCVIYDWFRDTERIKCSRSRFNQLC